MKRFFLTLNAVLMAAVAIPAMASGPAAMLDDGTISLVMPAPPAKRVQEFKTGGGAAEMTEYMVKKDGVVFLMTCVDYPYELSADFETLRESFLDALGEAKVELEGSVKVNGASGYTFRVSQKGMVFVNHMFVSGKRMYQLIVVAPAGEPMPAAARDYIESFHLRS